MVSVARLGSPVCAQEWHGTFHSIVSLLFPRERVSPLTMADAGRPEASLPRGKINTFCSHLRRESVQRHFCSNRSLTNVLTILT